MSNIMICCEAVAGADKHDAESEAQALANRTSTTVELTFNNKHSYFHPQSWKHDGTTVDIAIDYRGEGFAGKFYVAQDTARRIVALVPGLRERINDSLSSRRRSLVEDANKCLVQSGFIGDVLAVKAKEFTSLVERLASIDAKEEK